MPRNPKASSKPRHDPLHIQLDGDDFLEKYGRVSQPGKRRKARNSTGGGDGQDESEDELEMPEDDLEADNVVAASLTQPRIPALRDEDDEDDGEPYDELIEDVEEVFEIDEGDMQTLDALLPPSSTERRTLADIIFAKLENGESPNTAVIQKVQQDPDRPDPALGLDPKVVESYTNAFFKGIVFPMLDSGCSLKEAAIVASVVAKNKVPVLHASAALMRIAEMDYTGPNSLFIRVLVDKKFQLPYKVVDSLVFHFIRLSNTYKAKSRGDAEKLPVLWHQSLLAFAQRYASDLTPEQKDALLDIVRATPHPQIGPEVRRELINSVPRGAPRTDGEGDIVMG
ncbi:hypothetical protein ONZ45_g95 [Pleurotus djamor]|nr:hypothetical protein ONZ45_g95 [Pleurotus djamor]